MSARADTVFATHDGHMQFYAVRGGAVPDDDAFQEMAGRAAPEWPALLAIDRPVFVVKFNQEGVRRVLAEYERLGVNVGPLIRPQGGPVNRDQAEALEQEAMRTVAIAFDACGRLWGCDFRLDGNVIALADGRRIEILPLWSGRMADGERGWLYTLAVLPGELRTQEVPPRPAPAPPAPAGPRCNECAAPALYACGRCGSFCCEAHLDRSSVWRQYGAVCSSCASAGCVWLVINLSIVGLLVLGFVIAMAVSKMK